MARELAGAIRYLRAIMQNKRLSILSLVPVFGAVACVVSAACVAPRTSPAAHESGFEVADQSAEQATRERPFISLEYDAYRASGTGVVSGQAFLRTRGGEVKFGAGSIIHLVPVTSYSFEWYDREVLGGEALEGRDARAEYFHWTVRADGFGEFRFEELPPGEYFVAGEVRWEIRGANGEFYPAGGWAHARAKVRDDATTRAVLTR